MGFSDIFSDFYNSIGFIELHAEAPPQDVEQEEGGDEDKEEEKGDDSTKEESEGGDEGGEEDAGEDEAGKDEAGDDEGGADKGEVEEEEEEEPEEEEPEDPKPKLEEGELLIFYTSMHRDAFAASQTLDLFNATRQLARVPIMSSGARNPIFFPVLRLPDCTSTR